MSRRQPLPRVWMMTDERQGSGWLASLEQLPRGAGVVFRHYSLPPAERRAVFERVKRLAHRRRLVLVLAGSARQAKAWGADGSYGRAGHHCSAGGLRTCSAHDLRQVRAAERAGCDALFLSPLFATRSHPGAPPLGRVRFARLASHSRIPVIALGGVRPTTRGLAALGAYGWAGIDAWS